MNDISIDFSHQFLKIFSTYLSSIKTEKAGDFSGEKMLLFIQKNISHGKREREREAFTLHFIFVSALLARLSLVSQMKRNGPNIKK